MNSSDRVAEDGHLKPPLPVPDYLDMLHAEHHQGVMVPTLDSCDQHTREQFTKDYGHLLQVQSAKRTVQPGVGILTDKPQGPQDDTQILPPPTYKLRTALSHIMLGNEAAAVKIVKDFTPDEAKSFLEALDTLQAMLVARYSVEFIDEMLTVEP